MPEKELHNNVATFEIKFNIIIEPFSPKADTEVSYQSNHVSVPYHSQHPPSNICTKMYLHSCVMLLLLGHPVLLLLDLQ